MASAEPYEVVTGKGKEPEIFPSNLIGKTSEVSAFVAGPVHDFDRGNKAFYRVISVDKNRVRSGPSNFAETPRPFIASRRVGSTSAGKEYRYVLESIRSIGELQCENLESKRYVSAFRGADELRFLLDGGPGWITLD